MDEPDAHDAAQTARDEHREAIRWARRRLLVGGLLLVAAMIALSVAGVVLSPDEVITHRDLMGQATDSGSPLPVLVFLPMVGVLLTAVLVGTAGADHLGRSRTPDEIRGQGTVGLMALGLLLAVHVVIVTDAAQLVETPGSLIATALAVFLIIFGRTQRSGRVGAAGINLPLPDEPELRREVAVKAGDALVAVGAVGLVLALASFIPAFQAIGQLMAIAVLVIGLLVVCIQAARVARSMRT